ncbi:MAG: GntR family transcriptional regulator [Planctomycetaceae bacterium]
MPSIPIQFEIHPSSGVPIFRQIMDQIRALVASGRLKPGDLVPSVRQMAVDLQVNMMTVSKAYSRLEMEGLLERDRGTGMRVRGQAEPHGSVPDRQAELRDLVDHVVTRGLQLGLTDEQILSVVKTVLKERRG